MIIGHWSLEWITLILAQSLLVIKGLDLFIVKFYSVLLFLQVFVFLQAAQKLLEEGQRKTLDSSANEVERAEAQIRAEVADALIKAATGQQ